jgi:hypothetical protein
MHHFLIRVGLSNKRKAERRSSLRRGRSLSHQKTGLRKGKGVDLLESRKSIILVLTSADVGRPVSKAMSNGDMPACDEDGLKGRCDIAHCSLKSPHLYPFYLPWIELFLHLTPVNLYL